jgi:hypothetical protein
MKKLISMAGVMLALSVTTSAQENASLTPAVAKQGQPIQSLRIRKAAYGNPSAGICWMECVDRDSLGRCRRWVRFCQ